MGYEIRRKVEEQMSWVLVIPKVGAIACSVWVIYLALAAHGLLAACLAFLALAILYGIGISPAFAIAASFLCFIDNAVGIWLPLIAYVFMGVRVYADLAHWPNRRITQEQTPEK